MELFNWYPVIKPVMTGYQLNSHSKIGYLIFKWTKVINP